MAIQSFSDKDTELFFVKGRPGRRRGWAGIGKVARRKLDMLHYAKDLSDLRAPPGNRLEALKGRRKGWWSIRINNQWRIIFRWTDIGPVDVQITDYH